MAMKLASRNESRGDGGPKLPPINTAGSLHAANSSVPLPSGTHATGAVGHTASGVTSTSNDNGTFITGIRSEGVMFESASMDRVRTLHTQLTSVVSTLNDKVSSVLKKQESEFLRAYRAHMYSVQKELAQLRAKADDAALQLAKNEKIRQLEAERDWYRSEALRLDAFCSSLKSDVEYMRDKLAAVEDDRTWLERQLKTNKRISALKDSGADGDDGESTRDNHTASAVSLLDSAKPTKVGSGPTVYKKPSVSALPLHDDRTRSQSMQEKPLLGIAHSEGAHRGGLAESYAPGASQQHVANQLQGQLAAAQKTLEALKARNARLKATNAALRASRSELETFFLQCIEDVRKEVARRRVRAVATSNAASAISTVAGGSSRNRASSMEGPTAAESPGRAEAAVASTTTVDLAVALARARNATLADFTAADRRSVVTRLLQDDVVLRALHDAIFTADQGVAVGSEAGDALLDEQ